MTERDRFMEFAGNKGWSLTSTCDLDNPEFISTHVRLAWEAWQEAVLPLLVQRDRLAEACRAAIVECSDTFEAYEDHPRDRICYCCKSHGPPEPFQHASADCTVAKCEAVLAEVEKSSE